MANYEQILEQIQELTERLASAKGREKRSIKKAIRALQKTLRTASKAYTRDTLADKGIDSTSDVSASISSGLVSTAQAITSITGMKLGQVESNNSVKINDADEITNRQRIASRKENVSTLSQSGYTNKIIVGGLAFLLIILFRKK